MDIYLVNPASRPYTIEKNDFLVNIGREDRPVFDISVLESYYYVKDNKVMDRLLPYYKNFLLDSGAFTFLNNSHLKGGVNWDEYLEDYARYINSHKITKFFELDIDSIVGLTEVERMRKKLEVLTGKKPIPVWHKNRGKDYFVKMCEEYPYVALGGVVIREIPREKFESVFPWFIKTARERGTKLHCLGYTGQLKRYRFDSVDSTAWLYGNVSGMVYKFDNVKGEMVRVSVPEGKRLLSRKAAMNNFNEWVKYSIWAQKNL